MNITVAIPARNEAGSIGRLLTQVCGEDCAPHTVAQVLVYDDCSTDETAAIVTECAATWPIIHLLADTSRSGSTVALNAMLAASTGDVFVKMDADTSLRPRSLRRLATAITDGADLAMGLGIPACTKPTLVARGGMFAGWCIEELQRGRFGFDYHGAHMFALSGKAARQIRVPDDLISKDHYCVLIVRRFGGVMTFDPEASYDYLVPTTFGDYWRQSRRILAAERQLRARYADVQGSMLELLRAVWRCALRSPFAAMCWATIYCTSYLLPNPARSSAFPQSPSTKWPN